MKRVYKCEWCNFSGEAEAVEKHEENCYFSPLNLEKRLIQQVCRYAKQSADRDGFYIACSKKKGKDDECDPSERCFDL